ncbi:DarT ssDNA thymidine ADP-ribosyltransferase family protein [Serinibacter arcticus]|uniref:DarT ssDNA thymidine ADP-ribosyltransferase family protein n=1 Tax=Serinibacter arcticus TaxID=1655435 RepID=UPI0013050C54|nr:DarT ssDNA thymidine ADP-ribosyltransferase family protein [Serinibacter arcticus]
MTDIATTAAELGFTRLVHFTSARNLIPILRDGALRSSKDLAEKDPVQYLPTDEERFDAHPDHLCCSFEYPNAYYRDIAGRKSNQTNYPNWLILTLSKSLVLRTGALFAGCNAARNRGAHLRPGAEALSECWASPSIPGGRVRGATHLPSVPTDLQSEVLIPGPVSVSEVTGIIVESEAVAGEHHEILRRLNLNTGQIPWKVAPVLFRKFDLTRAIQTGRQPDEMLWAPEAGERL